MTTRTKRRRETVSATCTQSTTAADTVATTSEQSDQTRQPKEYDTKTSQHSKSLSLVARPLLSSSLSPPSSMLSLNVSRHKKRTKMTQLRENRRIQKAAAAMQEQLASFEQQQTYNPYTNDSSCSYSCYEDSSSFSAVSASSCSQQGFTHRDDSNGSNHLQPQQSRLPSLNQCCSDHEYDRELAVLARSLDIQESRNPEYGRRRGRRRRGGISVVVPSR